MDRASIINSMLSVIGESGISNSMSTHPSVQTASRILDTEDTDFQQIGWWFNKEYCLKLTPDLNGQVAVPANALDVQRSNNDCQNPTEKQRYTRRGNFMYDAIKHTDIIGTNISVDIIVLLSIESLPSVASSYLMHKAREAIYIDDDGDTYKTEQLQRRSMEAWQRLKSKELTQLSVNAMDNPTSRILRSGIGQSSGRSPGLLGAR